MNLKLGDLACCNILRTGPTGGVRVLHLGGWRDMGAGDLGRDVEMSFLPTGVKARATYICAYLKTKRRPLFVLG